MTKFLSSVSTFILVMGVTLQSVHAMEDDQTPAERPVTHVRVIPNKWDCEGSHEGCYLLMHASKISQLLDLYPHVTALNLSEDDSPFGIKDAQIQHVTHLPHLNLRYNAAITDDAVKNFTNLTVLDIAGSRITNEGLKGLTNLTELDIYDSEITDAGITHLTNLSKLCVSENITIKALLELPALTYLALGNDDVIGGEHIRLLPNLTFLDLENNYDESITVDIIESLPNLTGLRRETYSTLGDADLSHLTNLKELTFGSL